MLYIYLIGAYTMEKNPVQPYVFDFDDHLPSRAKARLHRMKRYRQYVAERARLSDLVAAHIAGGGTCADEPVLSAVRALEALGETLRPVMARLEAEETVEARASHPAPNLL